MYYGNHIGVFKCRGNQSSKNLESYKKSHCSKQLYHLNLMNYNRKIETPQLTCK